jgi:hypothetical protein
MIDKRLDWGTGVGTREGGAVRRGPGAHVQPGAHPDLPGGFEQEAWTAVSTKGLTDCCISHPALLLFKQHAYPCCPSFKRACAPPSVTD